MLRRNKLADIARNRPWVVGAIVMLGLGLSIEIALDPYHALGLAAVALPLVAIAALPQLSGVYANENCDELTGLPRRAEVVERLDRALAAAKRRGCGTGALVIEIDRFKLLEERYERSEIEAILKEIGARICAVLRESDYPGRLEGPTFAVALSAGRRLDLEAAIQLSGRIQQALAEPIAIDGANVFVTVSVGFSLANRLPDANAETLLQAATSALIEAQRYAPGAIRSYSPAMQQRISNRSEMAERVGDAIERGEIKAYFQPQVSTRTGAITGFEALSRWQHPKRGLIPPGEFLPALAEAGLMDKLGDVMVSDALKALKRWDEAGFDIPRVGVNFSNQELRDPRLVERIAWELDRCELEPARLAVEVLETVVANHSEDTVIKNLTGFAELGCSLDLDDFGTGHASITSIRRFSIERIKIDRSFVTRIDADIEQQRMVAAILTMAERLGLDTLAEGVETVEENAMLAKLGCAHVQGFGIARPMPIELTEQWIKSYLSRMGRPATLRRKAV